MLPCAVNIRRKLVLKYHIKEGLGRSILQVMCCPLASLVQMIMEVEEREGGIVGSCGSWIETGYSELPPPLPQTMNP
jgi:hypothetical protein